MDKYYHAFGCSEEKDDGHKPSVLSELLGCPFCGSIPEMIPWHGGGPQKRMVYCVNDDCFVQPQLTAPTKKKAIAQWNIRAR